MSILAGRQQDQLHKGFEGVKEGVEGNSEVPSLPVRWPLSPTPSKGISLGYYKAN